MPIIVDGLIKQQAKSKNIMVVTFWFLDMGSIQFTFS